VRRNVFLFQEEGENKRQKRDWREQQKINCSEPLFFFFRERKSGIFNIFLPQRPTATDPFPSRSRRLKNVPCAPVFLPLLLSTIRFTQWVEKEGFVPAFVAKSRAHTRSVNRQEKKN
jgi:hypothetical protein